MSELRPGLLSALVTMVILLGLVLAALVLPDWASVVTLALVVATSVMYVLTIAHLVQATGGPRGALGDGRTYLFTMLLIYAVTVPLLSLVDGVSATQLQLLPGQRVRVRGESTVVLSQVASIALYLGTALGAFGRLRGSRSRPPGNSTGTPLLKPRLTAMAVFWLSISTVSTGVFLIPFLSGGFATLSTGGTAVDVPQFAEIVSGSVPLTIVGMLFSPEVMTASTLILLVVLYARYRQGGSTLPLVLVVGIHLLIAVLTTRTIRAMILLFALIAIGSQSGPAKGRAALALVLRASPVLIVLFGVMNLAPSLLSKSSSDNFDVPGNFAETLRSLDPSGPYDALFRALHQETSFDFAMNLPISFMASIPFIGSSLLGLLGLSSTPPVPVWMANQYPEIYGLGGGLASMPQVEGYLTAGVLGCALTGLAIGLFSRFPRTLVGTVFVIAVCVLFARGSLGIVSQLFIPYAVIVVFLFGTLVSGALRIPTVGDLSRTLEGYGARLEGDRVSTKSGETILRGAVRRRSVGDR